MTESGQEQSASTPADRVGDGMKRESDVQELDRLVANARIALDERYSQALQALRVVERYLRSPSITEGEGAPEGKL